MDKKFFPRCGAYLEQQVKTLQLNLLTVNRHTEHIKELTWSPSTSYSPSVAFVVASNLR